MEKLKQIIDRWVEEGEGPKGFSPYMFYVLIDIYKDLLSTGEAEFITNEAMYLLTGIGIEVRKHGVGWIALCEKKSPKRSYWINWIGNGSFGKAVRGFASEGEATLERAIELAEQHVSVRDDVVFVWIDEHDGNGKKVSTPYCKCLVDPFGDRLDKR